jgi:hypothetical protein
LLRKTRSILDELDSLKLQKDKHNLVESRASHVIQGAINLINFIKENYSPNHAEELERRLINSIRSHDSSKFNRGIKRIISESEPK